MKLEPYPRCGVLLSTIFGGTAPEKKRVTFDGFTNDELASVGTKKLGARLSDGNILYPELVVLSHIRDIEPDKNYQDSDCHTTRVETFYDNFEQVYYTKFYIQINKDPDNIRTVRLYLKHNPVVIKVCTEYSLNEGELTYSNTQISLERALLRND